MKIYSMETIKDVFQLTDADMSLFKEIATRTFFEGREVPDAEFVRIVAECLSKIDSAHLGTLQLLGYTKNFHLEMIGTLVLMHIRNALGNN
jgi:hypothetical protein